MPTLTFIWHTHFDLGTCKVCKGVHGYQWLHQIGIRQFPQTLVHPVHGPVWDCVADQPLSHGYMGRRGKWRCRCRLAWVVDDRDLVEEIRSLRQTVRLERNRLVASIRLREMA